MPRSRSRSVTRARARTRPSLRASTTVLAALLILGCGDAANRIALPDDALRSMGGRPVGPLVLAPDPVDVIPGRYIITFDRSVTDPAGLARSLAATHGATIGFVYTSALKGFSASL